MYDILFVAGESVPFIKTGGLADVVGSLPDAVNKKGGHVRVIIPKYGSISQELLTEYRHITEFNVELGWRNLYCGLGEIVKDGVHYYFIDNEFYFNREDIYGCGDDAERFAFFSRSVLESLKYMEGFNPRIIHCHDWHTALIPLMLREYYGHDPFYFHIRSILTIHNLRHQGIFPQHILEDILGINPESPGAQALKFNDTINYFKAGITYANAITTVSPSYSLEIQDPYFGEGLDGVLRDRRKDIWGILNGIDYNIYNPLKDPHISINYRSALNKKADNKVQLQGEFGLPKDRDIPLIGIVTRLDAQKGLDLLGHIMDELMMENIQMVVLGTGEAKYEDMFYYFASKYPENLAARIDFNTPLAHKIYASSDMLLMPSQFEPCGLAQMIAMAYSTVPIVRETGGLQDTVIPYNQHTGEGNGFSFKNYNAHELLFTLQRAIALYREDKVAWKGITEKGRKMDFSWANSAKEYIKLYEVTLE